MPDGSILRSFDASCGCDAIFVAIGFVAVVVVVGVVVVVVVVPAVPVVAGRFSDVVRLVVVAVVVDRTAGPFVRVVVLVLVVLMVFVPLGTDAFGGLPWAVDVVAVVVDFGAGACGDVGRPCCSANTGRAVNDATATSA